MTGFADPYPDRPLSYVGRLALRDPADIDLVVIHCTELPDLATAREYGEQIHYPESRTGNCGHYYINRNGQVERWASLDRVAHHVRGYNERSVGIELVNRGRWPDWLNSGRQDLTEPYPEAQIQALTGLLNRLQKEVPGLRWIAGHEDLDCGQVPASDDPAVLVRRKQDPGPLFPWAMLEGIAGLERMAPQGD